MYTAYAAAVRDAARDAARAEFVDGVVAALAPFAAELAAARAAPPRALGDVVAGFAAAHGRLRQRSPEWLRATGETFGGSEIASLLGESPYRSFTAVVAEKVAARLGAGGSFGGSAATAWGTLFEDVAAAVLADDLGAPVVGDEICIRSGAVRYSPDGFVVARVARGPGGPRLLRRGESGDDVTYFTEVLLVEIKCPFSREPDGAVPRHYRAQVAAGLVAAPFAQRGLFVDCEFCRCAFGQLAGVRGGHDTAYPRRARAPAGDVGPAAPVARGYVELSGDGFEFWGADAFRLPAGDGGDGGDGTGDGAADGDSPHMPVDLGCAPPALLERALRAFADGKLRARTVVCDAEGAAPAPARCVAVLPWKLVRRELVFVEREPGFAARAAAAVGEAGALVAAALADPDPLDFVRRAAARRTRRGKNADPAPDEDEDSLCDSVDAADAVEAFYGDASGPPYSSAAPSSSSSSPAPRPAGGGTVENA